MAQKYIHRDELANDLELLLTSQSTTEEFRAKYAHIEIPTNLESVWRNLDHFLDDWDIRQRDSVYRVMQESEMRKLILLLRSGAATKEINNINFLHQSDRGK